MTHFGLEKSIVDDFFKAARDMEFFEDNSMTNADLFEKFFPGRNDVVRLLMEPITYANGSTLDEPAMTYGVVFSNFMSKGVYTFKGGTDVLIGKMQKELLNNNVDIGLSSEVTNITVKDDRVDAVTVDGRSINCRCVVSNGNLLSTINDLVGKESF